VIQVSDGALQAALIVTQRLLLLSAPRPSNWGFQIWPISPVSSVTIQVSPHQILYPPHKRQSFRIFANPKVSVDPGIPDNRFRFANGVGIGDRHFQFYFESADATAVYDEWPSQIRGSQHEFLEFTRWNTGMLLKEAAEICR